MSSGGHGYRHVGGAGRWGGVGRGAFGEAGEGGGRKNGMGDDPVPSVGIRGCGLGMDDAYLVAGGGHGTKENRDPLPGGRAEGFQRGARGRTGGVERPGENIRNTTTKIKTHHLKTNGATIQK